MHASFIYLSPLRRDSLHKCTGIQAAVLSTEGAVRYVHWRRDSPEEWREIVSSLDSEMDLMLYPAEGAVPADEFDWTALVKSGPADTAVDTLGGALGRVAIESEERGGPGKDRNEESGISGTTSRRRRRIVLIEGPWEGAKTLAKQLIDLREELGLPPLTYLTMQEGVTARYWRLQHMGSSAVSTIEAIAHVVSAAVYSISLLSASKHDEELEGQLLNDAANPHEATRDTEAIAAADKCRRALLVLFNLQRYRVFRNVKGGARVPAAMAVSKSGGFETFWDRYLARHNICS